MGKSKILVIYTGGTIGSFHDPVTDSLKPVDFDKLLDFIPELNQVDALVKVATLQEPKDSSNMLPADWVEMVQIIKTNYEEFDGFVVLHGTDTMAYSASAVSFMIDNLTKPIIFTGSQIPLGVLRTDAKENIITALEIASSKKEDGTARVPEVSIYFEFKLYRANRTFKFSTSHFNAYMSPNYPLLAEAGVNIEYNDHAIHTPDSIHTQFYENLGGEIAILKLFPGITQSVVESIGSANTLKAVIIESFGSGNATLEPWFYQWMEGMNQKGILMVNITQCIQGMVEHGKYETGTSFKKLGVLSGGDMTVESAVTKLMYLLGNHTNLDTIKQLFLKSIRGERTNS